MLPQTFFRQCRIKASVINTQPTRDLLSELNIEKTEHDNKFKADVNQKTFLKVVEKALNQTKMKGVESGVAAKQKRTFKKIGKNLVLLKLFSSPPQSSSLPSRDFQVNPHYLL